ncbi:mono-functional DNA-alkylating methyl methanesulfonate N-term-domain-containing protein [Sordaria brevicollis]|uniref:DNA damage-binding protein 1 n=1 Tax=Sordaria brevicollis TaxID=83679 RepID=A0AAE0PHM9_SORBR|nr:mono-functional DNA-alkylating methyl methanesulfonate N-term-domain-containing protein [Sordaria brevicollis]
MAYVAPIHRPSSVRHALRINLLSPEEESLIIAKTNRIEIWKLADGHLSMIHSKVINGTITILQKLQPRDHPTDILFVATDQFEYFTAEWDHETQQLKTLNRFNDPGERHMRDSQSLNKCIVDPSGKFMAMHLWEGVMSVWRLGVRKSTAATLDILVQVRLSELFIKASTFLYTETGIPKVAFLYRNQANSKVTKLATYRLTSDDRHTEISKFDATRDREIDAVVEDAGAEILIPVKKVEEEVKRHHFRNTEQAKPHVGGLIVVGETRLLYIDEVTKTQVESALKEPSIFVAWAEYDPTHYFLADDYGNLHLLTILTEGAVVTGMDVSNIGKTARAHVLTYLGDDMLFIGSHNGNSQLYRLNLLSEDLNEILQLVQVLENIGPITDFTVMDMGNRENDSQLGNEYSSGQARIVTASGVFKDGTLRSVRSGVGLQDIAILGELHHTRALFSIQSYNSPRVDTLVASFLTDTRIFRFDPMGEIEEVVSFYGMDLQHQTLLAANLDNGQLLQVTTAAATLLDAESGVTIASWAPEGDRQIINASANKHWLLLSVQGTTLVSINIDNDLTVKQEKDISEQDQIACIHVAPQLSDVGVVGFWTSGTVSIIDMSTLEPIHGESLRRSADDASIPRDIVLAKVLPNTPGMTLFIAMEDGNVVTFNIGEDLTFSGRKSVILGTREARFHLLPQQDGIYSILATTEHPSLIYGAEGRIIYSAVTAEDATCVCPFDSEAFPGAVILSTENEIKISEIDTARQTHVRSLELGEMVRRIAYSPSEKGFGLGCIRREVINGEEVIQSSFKLVDEILFARAGREFMLGTPSYSELVEDVIRAELPDSYGNLVERFIVGTSFLEDPERGAGTDKRGRILVFGIDSNRDPYLVLKHELRGACRALAVMGSKIVAALHKTVVISQYEETSSTEAHLIKLASYRCTTYPVDIAVHGNIIAVADMMKSATLVEYVPAKTEGEKHEPAKLVEVARHKHSAWATAVAHVEGESWLEADANGNLMVLQRNVEGVTAEDQKQLRITSELNLGEQVNKIRPIKVETSPNAIIVPRAFLATAEGGIYMFGTIAHEQDLLLRFQDKLAAVIKTVGELDFNSYRAFRNAERGPEKDGTTGPVRFLDGELLERFLDVDEKTQKEICEGLGPSVEQMRNMVEELRRMH